MNEIKNYFEVNFNGFYYTEDIDDLVAFIDKLPKKELPEDLDKTLVEIQGWENYWDVAAYIFDDIRQNGLDNVRQKAKDFPEFKELVREFVEVYDVHSNDLDKLFRKGLYDI